MATNNPKVSGYVPQHVFDRFEQFYQERGLSMSQAVNEILAEYFGLEQSSAAPGGLLKERLERVERLSSSLGELLERVERIEQQLGGSASRLPVVHSERTEHRNQSTTR